MKNTEDSKRKIIFKNFIGGIGWAAGATFGFAILLALISFILNILGGMPLVGGFFANLIEAANQAMQTKGY